MLTPASYPRCTVVFVGQAALHVSCACSQPLAPACSWQLSVARDFMSLCLTPIFTWTEPSQLAWFNFFMTFLATFAPAALL